MGKKNTSSGNREAKVAKAGKRSGNQVYPAPLSADRKAAKEQGEQQFVARQQLTVTVDNLGWGPEGAFIAHDGRDLVYKTKKTISNAEFVFDPSRGRVVYSPSFKEKSKDK